MERRIKVCLPSTVRLVRASLPRGTDQVSLLIARRREAHARRQPGLNMYDDALEKEKKKRKKISKFFSVLIIFKMATCWPACLHLTHLHEVKCDLRAGKRGRLHSPVQSKRPSSFPDGGFAYDNCCCNQTFHCLQLCGPHSMFIRTELFVSSPQPPSPHLLIA